MHFWIDKRSQTCGFGRARVAASLSSGGLGFGPHVPRRIHRKSMVTPIHRYPTVENRPTPQQHQQQHSTNHHRPSANTANSTSHHQQPAQHHHHHHHHHSQSNLPQVYQQSHQSQSHHHQHHQHQQQLIQQQQHHPPQQQQCVVTAAPVPISHIYGGPSHSPELEHGTLGISGISPRPIIPHTIPPTETQLLPSHLKCGIWASLALATVFVAGAKFYFDHQGTGFEVLIFCAFSATFFLAACTVSLFRRPKDHHLTPSITTDNVQSLEHAGIIIQPNSSEIMSTPNLTQTVAPPPPYHIAILLPETSKDMDEETPPPSYDKIVI